MLIVVLKITYYFPLVNSSDASISIRRGKIAYPWPLARRRKTREVRPKRLGALYPTSWWYCGMYVVMYTCLCACECVVYLLES